MMVMMPTILSADILLLQLLVFMNVGIFFLAIPSVYAFLIHSFKSGSRLTMGLVFTAALVVSIIAVDIYYVKGKIL